VPESGTETNWGVTAMSNLEVHIGASWSEHVTYDSMPGIILNKRQL